MKVGSKSSWKVGSSSWSCNVLTYSLNGSSPSSTVAEGLNQQMRLNLPIKLSVYKQSGNHRRFPAGPWSENQRPHRQLWEYICLTLGVLIPRLLQRLDGWHFIYLHLLQQRTKAQCLIRLPPEIAHGARLFPAGVHEAAQTFDVHTRDTARIGDLYVDLDLFLRRFDRSRLNVAFTTLLSVTTARMNAGIVTYIASAVVARQFLDYG